MVPSARTHVAHRGHILARRIAVGGVCRVGRRYQYGVVARMDLRHAVASGFGHGRYRKRHRREDEGREGRAEKPSSEAFGSRRRWRSPASFSNGPFGGVRAGTR